MVALGAPANVLSHLVPADMEKCTADCGSGFNFFSYLCSLN